MIWWTVEQKVKETALLLIEMERVASIAENTRASGNKEMNELVNFLDMEQKIKRV